jgi:hypothetical protein
VKREPAEKSLLITQATAAAMIGVSTWLLLSWVRGRAGGFPAPVRIVGRTYLFSWREVEKWARL